MNRILGVLFMMILMSNISYSQNCIDGTASYATQGTSVYKDQVLWLTWGGTSGGSSGTHGRSVTNGTKTRAIFNLANK